MPIIEIWGVPDTIPPEKLVLLMNELKREIAEISALGLTEKQITIFFPRDLVSDGLGEEIIVFVKGLFYKPERTENIRIQLARKIKDRCCSFFVNLLPNEFLVECLIDPPFHPSAGFASQTMSTGSTRKQAPAERP